MLTSNPTAQHSGQSSLIDGTKASGAKHISNLSEADWLDPEFPFAINLATYNLLAGKNGQAISKDFTLRRSDQPRAVPVMTEASSRPLLRREMSRLQTQRPDRHCIAGPWDPWQEPSCQHPSVSAYSQPTRYQANP
jgi:hypothetical protein